MQRTKTHYCRPQATSQSNDRAKERNCWYQD